MSLTLVTARGRTRGKTPVEFSWQGYGKAVARKVTGKDGEAVKREDGSEIEIDDLDVSEIVTAESLPDVLGAFNGDMKSLLTGALEYRNSELRKEASPVTETVTEDELTPMETAMRAAGLLDDKSAGVWRRTVSMSAKEFDMSRIDAAKMTKTFKALPAAVKSAL